MEKQVVVSKVKGVIKILIWLIFCAFFFYSFQNIMDFKGIANPRRQESFVRVLTALSRPNLLEGETGHQVVMGMWETVQIAFLATALSVILAIPFTFLSARPSSVYGHLFNILLQPILSVVRAVHPLIITIPTTILIGIGPTSGALALTLFSTAVLIGNYSEYAQQNLALNWGVLFKMHFPGLALKQLPINTLIATVLGFTGGGGIGLLIREHISLLNYGDASVAILACVITIGSLDLLTRVAWRNIHKI